MNDGKCPFCGAAINPNDDTCSYCGQKLNNNQRYNSGSTDNNNAGNNNYNNYNYQNSYDQYQYLKPYYQEEFRKMDASNGTYKGKWNWCAFLFGWIWALTKGLWGIAVVNLAIFAVLYGVNTSWLSLAIMILYGVRGNYFYYNLIKNKKQFPNSL